MKLKINIPVSLIRQFMLSFAFCLGSIVCPAQEFTGKVIQLENADRELLNRIFNKPLTIFELDVEPLYQYVKANPQYSSITLTVDSLHRWNIDLHQNELRSGDYKEVRVSENGLIELPRAECITYAGNLKDNIENMVRLNITQFQISGYIFAASKSFHIEPLSRYLSNQGFNNKFILYSNVSSTNVAYRMMPPGGGDCRKLKIATDNAANDTPFPCSEFDNQELLGRLNLCEGVFLSTFNIKFQVVYQRSGADYYGGALTCPEDNATTNNLHRLAEYWTTDPALSSVRRDITLLCREGAGGGIHNGCAREGSFGDGYNNDDLNYGAYAVTMIDDNSLFCASAYPEEAIVDIVCYHIANLLGATPLHSVPNSVMTGRRFGAQFFSAANIVNVNNTLNYISAELNDGRSAFGYYGNLSVLPLPALFTSNEIALDNSYTFSFPPFIPSYMKIGDLIFQATDSIKALPGFRVVPTTDNSVKLKIGPCDPNSR